MKFLAARHFRPANRTAVDLVVIHSAEVGEAPGVADNLMRACAVSDRIASWHYAVDDAEVTQSVLEKDVAFHAPGANFAGIGIELAGRAAQTAAEWDDPYSRSVVARAAGLTADICQRWNIPVAFVPADALLRGVRGITTHAEVSRAWKKSDHSDPGPNFPIQRFLDLVLSYSSRVA